MHLPDLSRLAVGVYAPSSPGQAEYPRYGNQTTPFLCTLVEELPDVPQTPAATEASGPPPAWRRLLGGDREPRQMALITLKVKKKSLNKGQSLADKTLRNAILDALRTTLRLLGPITRGRNITTLRLDPFVHMTEQVNGYIYRTRWVAPGDERDNLALTLQRLMLVVGADVFGAGFLEGVFEGRVDTQKLPAWLKAEQLSLAQRVVPLFYKPYDDAAKPGRVDELVVGFEILAFPSTGHLRERVELSDTPVVFEAKVGPDEQHRYYIARYVAESFYRTYPER